jgi:hypothetical protein
VAGNRYHVAAFPVAAFPPHFLGPCRRISSAKLPTIPFHGNLA